MNDIDAPALLLTAKKAASEAARAIGPPDADSSMVIIILGHAQEIDTYRTSTMVDFAHARVEAACVPLLDALSQALAERDELKSSRDLARFAANKWHAERDAALAQVAQLREAVRISRGNVASLGPAGALQPFYCYREWLAMLDAALAGGAQTEGAR